MSDLFEDDETVELVEEFEAEVVAPELSDDSGCGLDARRRLESMLEEKRLRKELDDF